MLHLGFERSQMRFVICTLGSLYMKLADFLTTPWLRLTFGCFVRRWGAIWTGLNLTQVNTPIQVTLSGSYDTPPKRRMRSGNCQLCLKRRTEPKKTNNSITGLELFLSIVLQSYDPVREKQFTLWGSEVSGPSKIGLTNHFRHPSMDPTQFHRCIAVIGDHWPSWAWQKDQNSLNHLFVMFLSGYLLTEMSATHRGKHQDS